MIGPGDRLLIATHNDGKLEEFRALFAPHGIEVQGAADHDLAAPAETGRTFAENARIKARAAARATGLTALGDDSGLQVDALGGAPGVATADWAETGAGRDFGHAMGRVRRSLDAVGAEPPWTARFRAVLALAGPDKGVDLYEGVVEGALVWPPRGMGGHGYDPMFRPEGAARTFAEMEAHEKNAQSHRARAAAALLAGLGLLS